MADTMKEALSGSASDPAAVTLTEPVFDEWFSTLTKQEHWTSEIGAIMQGWSGAIDFQKGALPCMPFEEAVNELAHLGHPLFQEIKESR